MKTRTLLLAAAMAAPVVFASAPASAWAPLDPAYPVWANMPVNFKINQGTIPSSLAAIAVARIDSSYAQWETAGGQGCTFFDVNNQGDTTSSNNYQDGKNVIKWISSSWPASYGPADSVIGVTFPVWNGAAHITDADIVFNDVGFCWNDTGSGNCVDVKSIATHEQGHFLGLDHTNANGATMEPFYPGGQSQATIAQDDIDGVCALYPIGGSTVGSGSTSSGGAVDCTTCSDDSTYNACAGAYNACGNSQDCIDFFDCLNTCSTQSCVDACVSAHPTGTQLYIDLIDCICADCAVECSAECGGSSSSSSTSGSTTSNSSTGNTTATTATTGGGETTGVGGAGGAGATAGVGGDDSSAATTGGGTKKKPSQNNVQEVSGCSIGHSSTGVGALLFVAALGAAAGRRKRAKKG